LEQRLIDNINRKPYSFWEVLSVDPGRGMTLKDLFMGDRIDVQERTGSNYVKAGAVLFGRAVSVDGVGMIAGLYPASIPPGRKAAIIRLRQRMRGDGKSPITDYSLYDWETEIRGLFYHIDDTLFSLPEFQNTDGDPLEMHRLVYEVPSAQEAFDGLSGLCATMTPEEISEDAQRDDAGRIVKVEIPWDRLGHKASPAMGNTVLGRIVIDGRRLTAEINSAARATALRGEIDARMGDSARFQLDEIQDMAQAMEGMEAGGGGKKGDLDQEALMQLPEVQGAVAEMIAGHWEGWADTPIPALGGLCPAEAVKTEDGREAVEALLQEAVLDRGQDAFTLAANRKGVQGVRVLLGLCK